MDEVIDLRVAELLASRLCHDLISPIGAVNNGLELLEEDAGRLAEDALDLAAKSGRHAGHLLQYFRLAFGQSGSGSSARPTEIRDLIAGVMVGTRHELEWPEAGQGPALPPGAGKIILNLAIVATDLLPRGGKVSIGTVPSPGWFAIAITASGPEVRISNDVTLALDDDADTAQLTPRTVQVYFVKRLARRMGGELVVPAPARDHVRLTVALPVA
jgi:histidine phosphotransferase ChpT